MKRRNVVKALLAAGLLQTFNKTTKSYAQSTIRLKLCTTWSPKMPILQDSADLFADLVKAATNNKVQIKVYAGGELIPAFGVFDSVSQGSVDLGIGSPYYWGGKSVSFPLFATVPFGLNAQQFNSWLLNGGGNELWQEAYKPFNLVPFSIGNTGTQMGGWYKKPINSVQDLKGLKIRIPGIGGEIMSKVGANVVLLPGSEVYTALERGTIDAAEWTGPFHDERLGLHRAAKNYYYPGWQEPCSNIELIANSKTWSSLDPNIQAIIKLAADSVARWCLLRCEAENGPALKRLKTEHAVQVKLFPDDVIKVLKEASISYLTELRNKDPFAAKVIASVETFKASITEWANISEQAIARLDDI
jgi:TRAP-type mannitol/chloroaromatic compound transport system substrate-binding protein